MTERWMMPKPLLLLAATLLASRGVLPCLGAGTGASEQPASADFFEKRVRPVLVQQCYKCHSASSEKLKGNLYLDTRDGMIQGGDTGPAIVPGHPEKSLLITAINYSDQDMQMPPKTRLAANVVADLTRWVQAGAPWPKEAGAVTARPAGPVGVLANYDRLRKEHWAWQPLKAPAVPAVKNTSWPHSDIDRFVLAKLDEVGLKPVADADKTTLIRRVAFDLIGLPPTPEEVSSFVADPSPNAYEKVVDRLLASPAFGERWGRHWLDVARYAESTGSSRNVPYTYAWRYRDYVIDAFNQDKPYDRFLTEQIAGDLLPFRSEQQHNEQLIATGFLAIGVKDLNERDRVKYNLDNVDEQIDVTTRSIMALTVACARCHDHKFDPIPTAEYYSLAGIFKSTTILAGVQGRTKGAQKKNYDAPEMLLHLANAGQAETASLGSPAAPAVDSNADASNALQAKADLLREKLKKLKAAGNASIPARRATRQQLNAVESQLQSLQAGGGSLAPALSTASAGGQTMGVRDADRPQDCAICLHGEPHEPGSVVPRGFVKLVPSDSLSSIEPNHSGRLELAAWLTSPQNPLTPRVMANRIWGHLFGEGIVRTVDNFGSTGEAPANQPLLDDLAVDFMKGGWSVKQLVRRIALSHAYQLSSASSPAALAIDPGDRLTWRMAPRRLDAEEIRDAILTASGKLDRSHEAGSPAAGLPVAEIKVAKLGTRLDENAHRSVYLPILRDLVPPVLDLFDFAEPTMVIGTRDNTTVATQALYLMNDPFVTAQAREMGERVQNATGMDDPARVDYAYRLALGRAATTAEKSRAARFLTDFQHDDMLVNKTSLKTSRADAWASFCQALMGSAEFRYLN